MDKLKFTNETSFNRFKQLAREYVAKEDNLVTIVGDYGQDWDNDNNFKHWYWLHAKLISRRVYAEEGGVERSGTGCKATENICVAMYNIGQMEFYFEDKQLFDILFLSCAAIGDVREKCSCFETDDICDECGDCATKFAPTYKETDRKANKKRRKK